jgi:hypothetical protein
MTDIDRLRNLHDTRDRIYEKSNVYFTSIWNRRNATQKRWFHGAMDALLDASEAAASFHLAVGANPGANLLACYGFLQAIYVQQDAVLNLCKALQLKWHPNDEERLSDIRNLRNRLCGHPASSEREASSARPSSRTNPKCKQFLPPNRNQCYTVSCRRTKDRNMRMLRGKGRVYRSDGMNGGLRAGKNFI